MKEKLKEIWKENKTIRYTTAALFVLCLLLGSSILGVSNSNGKLVSKIENLQEEKTSLNKQLTENKKNRRILAEQADAMHPAEEESGQRD